MKKYVLSAKHDDGYPASLAEDYGLFDKFYENIESAKKIAGSFPWYSNSWSCELPENSCYITKYKKIDFGIRSLSGDIYIASEAFLAVMHATGANYSSPKRVDVRNAAGKYVSDGDYYIVRIDYLNFSKVADLKKSSYEKEDTRFNLSKLFLKNDVSQSLFGVDDLIGEQTTLFCSAPFHDAAIAAKIKGVNFYPVEEARWQTMTSFLTNAGNKEPRNTVWPI